MQICRLSVLIIFGLFSISACSSRNEKIEEVYESNSTAVKDSVIAAPDTLQPALEAETVYKDSSLDNMARFLSGLPQQDSSTFLPLETDGYWKEYKTSMDDNWNSMYQERLEKIKNWQATTFASAVDDTLGVFYPFSGPDFLHAYYLYPHAKEFILVALEPIIEMPPLDTLSRDRRNQFLDSLENSLRDIFKKSYFITHHMAKDLKQVKGVLPPLFFFLERSGHEILEMKFITLDSAGTEKEVEARKLHWQKTPGVKITFRNRGDLEIKNLYYFGISISNKGINERPEFVEFIAGKSPFNTFVKSASYLMHDPVFTNVKELILTHSLSLFQDDTGIPYKDLKNQLNLDVHLYGDYAIPVKDFGESKFQPDLDSAFKARKHRESLPFSLGYHWRNKKQHYMLAKKQSLVLNK